MVHTLSLTRCEFSPSTRQPFQSKATPSHMGTLPYRLFRSPMYLHSAEPSCEEANRSVPPPCLASFNGFLSAGRSSPLHMRHGLSLSLGPHRLCPATPGFPELGHSRSAPANGALHTLPETLSLLVCTWLSVSAALS